MLEHVGLTHVAPPASLACAREDVVHGAVLPEAGEEATQLAVTHHVGKTDGDSVPLEAARAPVQVPRVMVAAPAREAASDGAAAGDQPGAARCLLLRGAATDAAPRVASRAASRSAAAPVAGGCRLPWRT